MTTIRTNRDIPTVGIKDVARRAGVAPSSVSRVLNGHRSVSPEMRTRVREAISELGYEPNLIGSSLRSGTTKTAGLLVSDIANSLFADMAKGAEMELQRLGYALLLVSSGGVARRDERAISLLRSRRADGLIVAVSDETNVNLGAALRELDVPVVLMDRHLDTPVTSVVADHRGGVVHAAGHLLDLGHERVALIAGPTTTRPTRERLEGFRAAHQSRGVAIRRELVSVGVPMTPESGEDAVRRLLRLHSAKRPTAVIVGGHQLFTGVLRVLRETGTKVPAEVSLITCDDVPLAELHTPAIAAVSRDSVNMGRVAARLLLDHLAHPAQVPSTTTLPTQLVLRESTAPPLGPAG